MITVDTGSKYLDALGYSIVAHAFPLFNLPEDIRVIVQGGETRKGSDAECWANHNGLFLLLTNSEIGWTSERFVKVLGHEMVHVKQYVFDGLDLDGPAHTASFKGSHYRMFNDAEYWLAPWEIEARGYEDYFWWRANFSGWVIDNTPNEEL